MAKPIIGITGAQWETDSILGRIAMAGVSQAYVSAVERAGAVPVVLPVGTPASAAGLCRHLSGLVMSGGGDVNPQRYGQDPVPQTYGVSDARDDFEIALLHGAIDVGMPVLAICRGLQVLNVAHGGTLHQHLPDYLLQLDSLNGYTPTQRAVIAPGTCLRAIVGTDDIKINSLHHQAVDEVGAGLRVTARTGEVVEGLEVSGRDNVVGVQWHPELLVDSGESLRLFEWLVGAARARALASAR